MQMIVLRVTAIAASFRRAGHSFSRAPATLPLAELDLVQISALINEPELVVEISPDGEHFMTFPDADKAAFAELAAQVAGLTKAEVRKCLAKGTLDIGEDISQVMKVAIDGALDEPEPAHGAADDGHSDATPAPSPTPAPAPAKPKAPKPAT